jgi:hypothetical protein
VGERALSVHDEEEIRRRSLAGAGTRRSRFRRRLSGISIDERTPREINGKRVSALNAGRRFTESCKGII